MHGIPEQVLVLGPHRSGAKPGRMNVGPRHRSAGNNGFIGFRRVGIDQLNE